MNYRFTIIIIVIGTVFGTFHFEAQAQSDQKFLQQEQIISLLNKMTLEEKFRQMFMTPNDVKIDSLHFYSGIYGLQFGALTDSLFPGGQMLSYDQAGSAGAEAMLINAAQSFFVESSRLRIPIIPFDEGLHGLVRSGATAFPQAIALSATWDTNMMRQVASAIAKESRSRGIRHLLSPVVNLATDVRWGRTEETYGEDPFLTSMMAVTYVRALEESGVVSTPKHFAANVGDGGRDSYPVYFSERKLNEKIFPPFKACIETGHSRSIMTAYNSLDGTPCTSNSYLLKDVLRDSWGFDGVVVSDAAATGGANVLHMTATDYQDATTQAVEGGLDVIFQTQLQHQTLFMPPFIDGSLSQNVIDSAVIRVLRLKYQLGLFDDYLVNPDSATFWNGHPDHRNIALEAALESIVLLKNKDSLLPLKANVGSIAVIGEDAVEARLGGYSGPGNHVVSILDGIRQQFPESSVLYTEGAGRSIQSLSVVPSSMLYHGPARNRQQGLQGRYFDGLVPVGTPVLERSDRTIDFQWTLFSPDPEHLNTSFYSVQWTGEIMLPDGGIKKIGVDGNDGYRLWIGNKLLIDRWTPSVRQITTAEFDFEEKVYYPIRIDYHEPVGNAVFRLVFETPDDDHASIEQAVSLARRSDVAVVVAGINEGEFMDRAYLTLPGHQELLINSVAATGTPVVVILVGGSAIIMENWLDKVESIIDIWYPGEAGGTAVAMTLVGVNNPAGRLPITFPRFEGQLPLVYNHEPTGRGDDYNDLTGQPRFPFGYGLSYTHFKYKSFGLTHDSIQPDQNAVLNIKVSNVGNYDGDEVVQVYLRDEKASLSRPVLQLVAFKRVHIKKGGSVDLQFLISAEMLTMLDKNLNEVVEPGLFTLYVGSSSRDLRLKESIFVVKP